MRIIYLHQYFNTPEMSGGTRSYEMARRLVAAGHDVHMVTSWRSDDDRPRAWFSTEEAGIRVHWLPVPYSNHMSYAERVIAFFRFAYHAINKSKELEGDVVFATSTPLTIAIPAVLAARAKKVPMVFEVRDLWPELPIAMNALRNPFAKWLAYKLERWAYNNSEAVVVLSPGMKEGVIRAGYSPERISVIPNSSDNDEFQYSLEAAARFRAARPWLKDRPLLVYAGTFGRINGVDYMVHLARELLRLDPEVRVLLLGDGQEKPGVKALAEREGVLGVNLFIEDSLPKKDMPSVLAAADMASSLFIDLPEMQANSANKFFDALAASTPVLINYGGWQEELIRCFGCGLSVNGKTASAAAGYVARYIRNRDWLNRSGAAARRLAETHFDRDKLSSDLEFVLEVALQRNGVEAHKVGFNQQTAITEKMNKQAGVDK